MYTEHVIEKVYWRMGEVAQMLQEQPSAIRFWMRAFGVVVKRGRGTDRFFTRENIETLKEIRRLVRVERYTIEGAVRRLNAGKPSPIIANGFSHLLTTETTQI